jgi:hypothetical protein
MANQNIFDPDYDLDLGGGRTTANDTSWKPPNFTGVPVQTAGPAQGGVDWNSIEQQLRASAGSLYDPSDLEGIKRNTGYNVGGVSLEQALANQQGIYDQRRGPTAQRQYDSQSAAGNALYGSGSGNATNRPGAASAPGYKLPGMQFDDPYTNLLEQISRGQLGEVRSNPGLDQLMAFLQQQFADVSQNPGYNPAEQAMLRTQALEPIEANRNASKQRALERTAARGFAPSSGLNELDLRNIDINADRSRTVADRDLAIAGLDRRDRDLNQALDIGQLMGVTIPRAQRGEEVALGNLLYQLPRTAMNDAMSVVNGSPSSQDAFSQAIQLLTNQQNQQGQSNAQNAALFAQIGQILAGLF